MNLKKKMDEILKKPRNYKAAKEMSQLIGQAIRYQKPIKKPKPNIHTHFSPMYHRKVHILLNYVSYNDKLEMVIRNTPIAQSNIIDIFREALVGSRKKDREYVPLGWKDFINVIAASDIPLSTFTKRTTKQDIQAAREQHGQPDWEMY